MLGLLAWLDLLSLNTLMSSYSHRFYADIHAPAAALCVTETGVLATACIHTKLQDVFADVFYVRLMLDYQANNA